MDITTWERRRGPDGEIELATPDGIRITIRERVRPIVTVQQLFGDATPVVLRTDEGEDGYIVIRERDDGARAIAVLEGDDFQTIIEGHALLPRVAQLRAAVTELATSFPLGLGTNRVRAVRHHGPPGWTEKRDGMIAVWTAPNDKAVIKVFPARPLAEQASTLQLSLQLHDEGFDGFALEYPLERTPLVIGALRGTLGRVVGRYHDGPLRVVLTAGLSDTTYRYVARIEHDALVDHDDVFFALVKSMVPIAPAPKASIAVNAVSHWAD